LKGFWLDLQNLYLNDQSFRNDEGSSLHPSFLRSIGYSNFGNEQGQRYISKLYMIFHEMSETRPHPFMKIQHFLGIPRDKVLIGHCMQARYLDLSI
jgi:hypothetical protein